VPVGEDQVAHIELTREVARKFNFHYKRVNPWAGIAGGTAAEAHHRFFVFEEPQPLLTPAAKLPGTDGRKMSKSYGNFILLSDTTEQVEEKLRGMVNDPARYVRENPGNPDVCPVGDLHKIFSGPETVSYISNGCRTASIGCVECKQLAADSINARLAPMRTRRSQYESDPAKIWERLRDGASKAEAQAEKTMKAVREAVGISREPSGFTSNVSKDPIVVGRPRFVPRQEIWHIPDRTERGDAIRTTWLQDHTDIKLTPLEHRTFATPGRKRIAMPTARETKTNHWYPRVRPKHYDVMVLLCWAKAADGTPGELLDFVVPRKLFETAWKLIPKKLKEYRLEVVRTGTQYSLNFGDLDFIGQASVDITHTLGNLDPIL
jgi:tryptophanyl-tRNA synthetase